MQKKTKQVIFLCGIWVIVIVMFVTFENFQKDKPLIQQQMAQNQQNLTPDQAINGIKNFVGTIQNDTKNPPSIIYGKP